MSLAAQAGDPRSVSQSDLDLVKQAREAAGDVDRSLALAVEYGRALPRPGRGETARLWSGLATLAAVDLTTARVVEPHLDALAILDEAPTPATSDEGPPAGTWGVFAAHAPGVRLEARTGDDGAWQLTGTKPWCSLAARIDHAVVTAHTSQTARRAFAVDLRQAGVTAESGGWAALGLRDVTSLATHYESVPASPVGPDEWYLQRPGFAWGGMGVAACWFGGAVGLARALREASGRRAPDQVSLMHLGAVDAGLHAARATLTEAAGFVDDGVAQGEAGALLAHRVRAVVAGVAEDVLRRVGHALGPAPLTGNAEHATRVADLQVYLRQHHAERDEAALGSLVLDTDGRSW